MEFNPKNLPKTPAVPKDKYELSLAEFPLAILSKRAPDKNKPIIYEDEITANGKKVKRIWKVKPDLELGHATASTYATLYEILQIWKESGFKSREINFRSLYNLAKRRGLELNKQAYKRIERDIKCLVGTTFDVKNAFWDNEHKCYVDAVFHLFDRAYIYRDKSTGQMALPLSTIKASDILYGSILANSLLSLNFDREFFHKLTPFEQRLALYLTKIFKFQKEHKRELLEFARQIPVYAKQKKHIKETIKKACNGLMKKGFQPLKAFKFEKTPDKTEYIIFIRREKAEPIPLKDATPQDTSNQPQAQHLIDYFYQQLDRAGHQTTSKELEQATRLLSTYTYEQAKYIIDYTLQDAEKTNYKDKIRAFGFIFQYEGEAIQAYDTHQKNQKQQEQRQKQKEQIEKTAQLEAEKEAKELNAFYNALDPNQKRQIDELIHQKTVSLSKTDDTRSAFYKGLYNTARYQTLKAEKKKKSHPQNL